MAPYWRAWNDLHPSRASGFGPQGLAITDIMCWLVMSHVPYSEWPDYCETLLVLDRAYLKWASDKHTAQVNSRKPVSGSQ